ncbi:outer membrane protein assembly factor BamE [Ideonella livida]|uniref:outer membrane protein assembly factor BamE n=1 Tax=Ideonella livida TaxID=2707176 RepID=UPI002872CEE5|nr:outer membrane protein assembly factor BamE [Ideonella livida]
MSHVLLRLTPSSPRPARRARPRAVVAALLACLPLAGCNTLSDSALAVITLVLPPYKADVVQGNVITREQLAQVKPGRSRDEVRELLGSPLLTDVFHAQRWDYVFTLRRNGVVVQQRSLVVWFEGDVVRQVDAPEVPSEREFVASIAPQGKPEAVPPKLSLTEAERAALPRVAPVAASAPAAPAFPTRRYPPLEPQ